MFASLMMASCSIARVENFSISRRRSLGLLEREEDRSPFWGGDSVC